MPVSETCVFPSRDHPPSPLRRDKPIPATASCANSVAVILDKHPPRSVEGERGDIGGGRMKSSIRVFSSLVASFWAAVLPANAQVNVTQEHNNPSRDGVYIDAAFTPSAAANLTRDLNFDGTVSGNVYAQPLYIEGGPNGPVIIAVTESNNVYALNATTGTVVWSRTDIGPPVQTTPCVGFNPTGITGTPVVDLTSRRLFFDALISGSPNKH